MDLKVDLHDTEWENLAIPMHRQFVDDRDWFQFEVADGAFVAAGDPFKLNKLVEQFIHVVWPQRGRG